MVKEQKGKRNKARIISINVGKHIPGNYDPDLLDQHHIRCLSDPGVRRVHLNSRVHGAIVVHKVTSESHSALERKIDDLFDPLV